MAVKNLTVFFMQFNDTANKTGIIQDITFLLGIDTNGYPLADRTRNINERFRMVWQMIFDSYGGWKFQDDNSDATPYTDQNLTSGTGIYTLPSGALTVRFVEVLNSGGTYERLRPLTEEEFKQAGGDIMLTSNSTPTYYLLYEDQIKLVPYPNYSQANGLRIYFDAGISTFVVTDTTKVPGFASPFHRMLSIGAALDYALARGLADKVTYLQNLWNDYETRLRQFYSKRFVDRQPKHISLGADLMDDLT